MTKKSVGRLEREGHRMGHGIFVPGQQTVFSNVEGGLRILAVCIHNERARLRLEAWRGDECILEIDSPWIESGHKHGGTWPSVDVRGCQWKVPPENRGRFELLDLSWIDGSGVVHPLLFKGGRV